MATELAQAYVQIIPSAKGIKNNIGREIEESTNTAQTGRKLGGKLGGALGVAAVATFAAAAAGLGAVISKSISSGADLQQSVGGVETLFKENADTVIKNANKAYKTAGLSANDYMESVTGFSASLLQSLGGDTEKAAASADQALIDMSDNANKFGTDMESIQYAYQGFAKQNYTMLDNLKLGYGGTKEEMGRLLSDAGKLTGKKYDIKNLNDVYEAIHVIQGELGVTGTTAKEAESTFSGSLASMKSAATNLFATLALGDNATMPVSEAITDLGKTVGTFLFKNIVPMIGNVIKALPAVIRQGGPMLANAGLDMIKNLSKGFSSNVGTFIKDALRAIIDFAANLRKYAGKFVDAGMNLMIKLAKGIATNLPTVIKSIPRIVTQIARCISENAPKIMAGAWKIAKTLAVGLIKSIPAIISSIPKIVSELWKMFRAVNWANLGGVVARGIKNGIAKLPGILKGIAVAAIRGIVNKFAGANFPRIMGNIFNAAKTKVLSVFLSIKTGIANRIAAIKKAVSGTFSALKNIMLKPVNAARTGLSNIFNKIKRIFKTVLSLKIKIPHISISGGKAPWGIAGKGKLPSFDVTWAKQGYSEALMADSPTLLGIGDGNGNELVTGESHLKKMIADEVGKVQVTETVDSGQPAIVQIVLDGEVLAQSTINFINKQTQMYGVSPVTV